MSEKVMVYDIVIYRVIFMEDHLKFWLSNSFEWPDRSLLQGRQTSKWSFKSMSWTYSAIVFHENISKTTSHINQIEARLLVRCGLSWKWFQIKFSRICIVALECRDIFMEDHRTVRPTHRLKWPFRSLVVFHDSIKDRIKI